jgi:hypothetical protein
LRFKELAIELGDAFIEESVVGACGGESDYPAIAARARREGAVVLWLDQTGIRSDAAVGVTWAPRGRTPVVGKTGKRFSVNAMCAIGNKGELYFTVYTGSFVCPADWR